jgi:hypothetical protein
MRNPTIKQVEYVIGRLQLVIGQACKEGALDMDEGRVYSEVDNYDCGTVHCVGGWYAFANLRRQVIKSRIKHGYVSFKNGAKLLANDLGFANQFILEDWANDNPRIWGNINGYYMFSSESAYDNPGYAGVIAQLELVKQNLIELKMEKTK